MCARRNVVSCRKFYINRQTERMWNERCHSHDWWAPQWSTAPCLMPTFSVLVFIHRTRFSLQFESFLSRVTGIKSRPQTRSSLLTRVRSRRLILCTLYYHPRWCSYRVRVSWFYLSFDSHLMYGLTLIYTHALDMYKTREFQTQLLHYFSKSDNKSNHYHRVCFSSCVCFAVCYQLYVLCAREVWDHVACVLCYIWLVCCIIVYVYIHTCIYTYMYIYICIYR